MNIAGPTASGVSVPISSIQGVGWRGSLAFWGILVLIAILVWLPHLKKQKEQPNHKINNKIAKGDGSRVWRLTLAWDFTLVMGLQLLMFYTLFTLLPDFFSFQGYSS